MATVPIHEQALVQGGNSVFGLGLLIPYIVI